MRVAYDDDDDDGRVLVCGGDRMPTSAAYASLVLSHRLAITHTHTPARALRLAATKETGGSRVENPQPPWSCSVVRREVDGVKAQRM